MCGIAGIWGSGNVEKMIEALSHRGPDGQATLRSGPIQLGASRLAILDKENGAQPMKNQKGSLMIVHNGEVYNFEEIREELKKKGYVFRSRTDTEVILNSYQEWGVDCLRRFNGMFALAIWNADERKLFLVRDRVGVKPLYWAHVQGRFLFASEVKAILTQYTSAPEIDPHFFNFECPLFEKTLFQNIRTLLPGHYLVYDGNRVQIHQYWSITESSRAEKISEEDAVEELRSLIEDSVRLRMKSDVPVGVFLSGGIDSSILASLSETKSAYTCTYPLGPSYDESQYATLLYKELGIQPVYVTPTHEDFQKNLKSIVYYLDHPVATASSLSEFLLARRAAQDVRVVLNGQGADEIFGGYVRYLVMLNNRYQAQIFESYADLIRLHQKQAPDIPFHEKYFHLSNRGSELNGAASLFNRFFGNDRSRIDQMGLCDMVFVLPSLLTMNDRAAAHVGMENRTPFLDYRIVEFAFSLPERMKLRGVTTKYVLRKAAKGWIPDVILNRSDKKGFVTPAFLWLGDPLKIWADDLCHKLRQRGIDWPEPAFRGDFDRHLYSKVCLELWFENYFPDFQL